VDRISVEIEYIGEALGSGGRLGRHVEHDIRSWAFAVPEAASHAVLKSTFWARRSGILDQGDTGSCTGNAEAGAIATDSNGRTGMTGIDEHVALKLYSGATRIDHIAGEYPPDDTGSTGLAVMKAAQRAGYIRSYRHAFSLGAMLHALQYGPAIVGMAWLTGCDKPDTNGLIAYSGELRGGHEILCRGVDMENSLLWFDNSWGVEWGRAGSFAMTFADFENAMADNGDMTIPVW
jgi:hypothetical protein